MSETNILAQFKGKSPLRIAGNLLLLWLFCIVLLVLYMFPAYPDSSSGWLWYLIAGPPAFLVVDFAVQFVFEWVSRWFGRKDPELRPWTTALIAIALI